MSTTTFAPFHGFDPIKGTVPDHPIYYLPIIANRARDRSDIESAEMIVAMAGDAALESFDCVSHARELRLGAATFTLVREVAEEAGNKKISLQNSKAAIHSHAKSNDVKAYALSLYEAKD